MISIMFAAGLLLAAQQSGTIAQHGSIDRYAKVRLISESVSGKRPATDDEVYALLLACMRDPDVVVRSECVGMVSNLVMIPAIPNLAPGMEWAVARRKVGERLWPELDAAVDDPEERVRRNALTGIAGAFSQGYPTVVLPSQIANRLLGIFERPESRYAHFGGARVSVGASQ